MRTSSPDTRRPRRVADQLQHEVARILQKDVKDPRIGLVTVTGAEVSTDLRMARVFYTVFGTEGDRASTHKGLASATPFIRREVGRLLRLKIVPDLRFEYDESLERGFRVRQLLEELGDEEKDRPD